MVTVALPTWRSQHIIWLALQGLCHQEDAPEWELIVDACDWGETRGIVNEHKVVLELAGCTRIEVLQNIGPKRPLGEKWRNIARHAKGGCLVLAASDNFSPPNRLRLAHEAILEQDYDWADCGEGLFYDIPTGRTATWKRAHPDQTGLWMCCKTEHIAGLKGNGPSAGIDAWIKSQLPQGMRVKHWEEPMMGLHTDGCNTISRKRASQYSGRGPFRDPTQNAKNILHPRAFTRLKEMRWKP